MLEHTLNFCAEVNFMQKHHDLSVLRRLVEE